MTAVLPEPQRYAFLEATLTLDDESTIGPARGQEMWPGVRAVRRVLAGTTGLIFPVVSGGHGGEDAQPTVRVGLDESLAPEAYTLKVDETGVDITAGTARGAGWAAQTLLQLGPEDVYAAPLGKAIEVCHGQVWDEPRFAHRGAHLDSSRHFVELNDVFHFLDWMAHHKLNVLHWHLTDDQGWRIASPDFPRLAEVASWRASTQNRYGGDTLTPHGGYYTLEQIRAVANYARDLGIETVPEIDFPGHATAVLNAYPEFATDPSALQGVAVYPTIFPNVIDFSPEALDFVHRIWEQVIEATGATRVHIGGDEVPTEHWEASDEVRARAAEFGVDDVTKIQRWFTLHMRDWLAERGVTAIAWDEVVDDGPVEGMICQSWRGAEQGQRAARGGMDVVMSPLTHTYYDFYQSDLREEPYGQGAITTIEDVLEFDPVAGLEPEAAAHVIGTQFQLWSEFLPDYRSVLYSAWPRGCALAEIAWGGRKEGDYEGEFFIRLREHLRRFDAAGVNYRPLDGPHPWQQGGTGWRKRPDDD
ncbi:MAG: beta-N-acetylhexosaminidase [Actinomycetaceae bacterium]|nr:beta-N-acetylhexosaminidase [Actinomycetaceae bacterium]